MSHQKKMLILKDVAYGVKDGSAAGTPNSINTAGAHYENLEDGALGIFVTNTDGKTDLVVDTGSSGAAQVNASAITDKSLRLSFRQGRSTAGQNVDTGGIPINSIKSVIRTAYTAPTKGVWAIGFNGTNGVLNLPTISLNDEAILMSLERLDQSNNTFLKRRYNAPLEVSATDYEVLSQLVDEVNNTGGTLAWAQDAVADILSDGTLTAFTGTPGTMDVVKGSTTVTFSSAVPTGSATGDYVSFHNLPNSGNNMSAATTAATGIVYKITVSGATWILDRPYTGETQQITQTNIVTNEWVKEVTVAGELGLRLVDKDTLVRLEYAVSGVLENATITTLTGSSYGSGAGILVAAAEVDMMYYRTMVSQIYETGLKKGVRFADATATYDIIVIQYEPDISYEFGKTTNLSNMVIAVPAAATSTNTAGTDFTTIIRDIFDASGFNVATSGF